MPEDRQPCSICAAQILLSTADRNGGLCGKCIRNPELARRDQKIREIQKGFGEPCPSTYERQLEKAVRAAISEALETYGEEGLGAIFLYGIAHVESPEVIAMSGGDTAGIPNTIWDSGEGWTSGSMIHEDIFMALRDFLHSIPEEFDARPVAEQILLKVREDALVPDDTFLCIVDEGDGCDEFEEAAAKFNSAETLKLHERWTRNPY